MAKPLLDDELWAIIQPILPPDDLPKPKGGRPPIPNRAVLTGILFVLLTGIQWEYLPKEMGCGSGMTCWRRLRDWQKAGIWAKLHKILLDKLGIADQIDWSRACVDASCVPAPKGGSLRAKIPLTGARRARSAISSRTKMVFRSLLS
jgi:transposase